MHYTVDFSPVGQCELYNTAAYITYVIAAIQTIY